MEARGRTPADAACREERERRAVKSVGYLPVLLCLAVVGWSYYAFVFRLSVPFLQKRPVQAALYLIIYHLLFILFIWSYFKVVFTHPGTPAHALGGRSCERGPSAWRSTVAGGCPRPSAPPPALDRAPRPPSPRSSDHPPSPNSSTPAVPMPGEPPDDPLGNRPSETNLWMENLAFGLTVKQNGRRRFCTTCNFEKPDRAHHCRVCRQCILKMDHHCPWINGCVGYRNQKHFVLFIAWGAVYCLFAALATLIPSVQALTVKWDSGYPDVDLNWAFLILFGGFCGVCLVLFAGYHINMVLNNRTTIEAVQRHKYRLPGGLAPDRRVNIFDVGRVRNFKQVMGERWYLWFVPVGNVTGDGIIYPLKAESYSTASSDTCGDQSYLFP